MTDAEIDALARELLAQSIKFVQAIDGATVISEIGEFSEGHIGPIYEGISPDGYGRFLFAFDPREAVKQIIVECERLNDTLELELTDAKTGKSITSRDAASQTPESREISIKTIAEFAVTNLIGMFGFRMVAVLKDAVDDSLIIAKTSLSAVVARHLTDKGIINTPADVRPLIEEAAKRAADRKREDLLGHIDGIPHLLAQRGRGGAYNVKHVWTDKDRECLATKYAELQPIWIEAKKIAKIAQESQETTRKREWRKEVLAVYSALPPDLLERFATLRADDAKPSDIAVLHAGRLCLPPNVELSVVRLRKELTAWKIKTRS